jgi:hypothetical protein
MQQPLRPRIKSGPGFFQSSEPELDAPESKTESIRPKG